MADVIADGGAGGGGGGAPVDPGIGLGGPPVDVPGSPLGGAPEPKGDGAPVVPPVDKLAPKVDAPPPPKVAPKAPTVGDAPLVDDKAPKPPAPADWPEDWREKLAGDNKKAATKLARMKSPQDVVNSYLALEAEVSSGKFAKKLPTNYTDAELADYRKSNNIPDKPEEYDVTIPGIVWGEADKPMLDSWRQFAHENHLPPELVKLGPAWYAREQEALVERLNQQDLENYQSGSAALQAEWGSEFRGNINAARNLFEAHPGVWDAVMSARGPDGVKNGDNPVVLKALASIAKEMNPFATVLPSAPGKSPQESLADEKANIKAKMGDKGSDYWRGPSADKLQARYREILDIEQKMAGRGGA